MPSSRVLVLGGIRSGKSRYAETLMLPQPPVRYLATSSADDDDAAWQKRIAFHRARRPEAWTTEEFGVDPDGLLQRLSSAQPGEQLLVDDLGGWLTATLTLADGWHDAHEVDDALDSFAGAVKDCRADRLVLVSPEVGLSVVPPTTSGRAFADALGRLNRLVAQACDAVVFVVAGQPSVLKGAADGPGGPVSTDRPGTRLAGVAARAKSVTPSGAAHFGEHLDLAMPDQPSAEAAVRALSRLDVAGSGLGALTSVVSFAAATQGRTVPQPWQSVRVVLVHCGRDGGAGAGDDPAAAARRLEQTRQGTGPLALLAAAAQARIDAVLCPTSAAMEHEDALGTDAVEAALATGWQVAEDAVDEGADALVIAAGGVGGEAAAAAVLALSAGGEPAALLDRVADAAGRVDDAAWMTRCAAVRDSLHRIRARSRNPREVLAMVGGGDIAVATGLVLGAAYRRTPVLIDGPVGAAAAIVARELAAQSRHWLLVADHGEHPTVRLAADVLGLEQLLHLRMRIGEGAGTLAALPVLRAALALAADAADAVDPVDPADPADPVDPVDPVDPAARLKPSTVDGE